MSILIDVLIKTYSNQALKRYEDGWFLAKPLNWESEYYPFWNRVKDAISVLRCKSFGVHFREDEYARS